MGDDEEMRTFERLVRIETKLEEWHRTYDDHESRLRKLERSVWIATGFAAALGGVAGQLAGHLFGA